MTIFSNIITKFIKIFNFFKNKKNLILYHFFVILCPNFFNYF